MRAGKLRHRIVIEQSAETQSIGEPALTWTTLATIWADYKDLGGSEGPAGGQQQFGVMRRQYQIRYLPQLDPDVPTQIPTKHRINHGGRLWDIDLVSKVDGRNAEMLVDCTGRGL